MLFAIEAVVAVIVGMALMVASSDIDDIFLLYGMLIFVLGIIGAWVSSWILYAFGELVEDVHELREANQMNGNSNYRYSSSSNYPNQQVPSYNQNVEQKLQGVKVDGENSEDDDFVDVYCPNCWKKLSFYKDEENAICPNCNTKISIK